MIELRGDSIDPAQVHVLDCGGGSGSLAVPLAVLGVHVTVVDVSVDALSTLLRRATDASVSERVESVQGDAESLADLVQVDHFDLVLAHDVLASVADHGSAVAQLAAVLKPGGTLSVIVRNPVSTVLARALAGDPVGALAALQRTPGPTPGSAGLMAECTANGLLIESVTGIGVFSDLVTRADPDGVDGADALADLEAATCDLAPFRDIASRIHVQAKRPISSRREH